MKQDPFRGGENVLVLCETCLPTGEPIPSNTRAKAREAFEAAPGLEPWFGIEQEYTLFDKDMVSFTSVRGRVRAFTVRESTSLPAGYDKIRRLMVCCTDAVVLARQGLLSLNILVSV